MVLYYLCEERVLELNAELTSINKPLYGATIVAINFPEGGTVSSRKLAITTLVVLICTFKH